MSIKFATEPSNGDSLPEAHGGERRFIRDGSPGFMHIKYLSQIVIQKSPSVLEIDKELMRRHDDPLYHLPERVRKLLAVCPKFDPYLVKSPDGKKILNFLFELPLSTKIYDVIRDDQDSRLIKIKGVSFSGEEDIESVCISVNGHKEQEAEIYGSGKQVLWEYQCKLDSADDKVDITAAARTKSLSQPDAVNYNPRGLFGLHRKASFNKEVINKEVINKEVRNKERHQAVVDISPVNASSFNY